MKFGVIEHFEWLKAKSGYHDFAASGVHGPDTLEDLGVRTEDLPLSGGNPYGYPPLKEWLAAKFGVTADRIALAQGASGANFAVMASLLATGDAVVLESPVYQPMTEVAEAVTETLPFFFPRLPEENYRLDPERPFSVLAKPRLIVTTNLHNPSGVFEPEDTFIRLADRASSTDGWVLVDEIFLPFREQNMWQTVAAKHDRIIATGSLTKAWGLSGLRLGWAVGPKDIIRRIQRLLDYTQGVQSVFNEALGLRLLESGVADKLLAKARLKADENRAFVSEWLARWGKVSFVQPDGGVILFARNKDGRNMSEFCKTLFDRHRILITPGHFFRDPTGFRLGYIASKGQIGEWLGKLHEVYEDCLDSEN